MGDFVGTEYFMSQVEHDELIAFFENILEADEWPFEAITRGQLKHLLRTVQGLPHADASGSLVEAADKKRTFWSDMFKLRQTLGYDTDADVLVHIVTEAFVKYCGPHKEK